MFVCFSWILWLPVSAAILVGAVHAANALIRPRTPLAEPENEEDNDEYLMELRARRPIPVPSLAFALATAFLTTVFAFGGMIVAAAIVSQFESEDVRLPMLLLSGLASFGILSTFLWGYLPCTFKRSLLVAAIHHLVGAIVLPVMSIGARVMQDVVRG